MRRAAASFHLATLFVTAIASSALAGEPATASSAGADPDPSAANAPSGVIPPPPAAAPSGVAPAATTAEGPYARWRRELRSPSSEALAAAEASDTPITYELGSGWDLELGAQWRVRAHSDKNRNLRDNTSRNDYVLNRVRAWAEARHESGWRFYFEGIDARIGGEDLKPQSIDRNTADIRNLYVGYDQGDTHARLGRTDLKYGAQRLISPLDWANTRRTFQGGVISQGHDVGTVDVFVTKPVNKRTYDLDHSDNSRWFSGIYSNFELDDGAGIDVYGLSYNETTTGKATAGDGSGGTFDIYTVGARAFMDDGGFDAEAEVAQQFGQFAGDDVDAAMFTARSGYTFEDTTYTPRVGLDLDWASGDDDPTDGDKGTFNQLFPLGHRWLGFADIVGRQNVLALSGSLELDLDESTKFWLAYHDFRLDDRRDGLYSPGGGVTLADPTGGAGTDVGTEWDIQLTRNLDNALGFLDQIQLGYAYFMPGSFVSSQTSDHVMTQAWLQFTAEF